MHPLTEGVTVVVTPSARWLGLALRRGACLDQLVDELARRDAQRARRHGDVLTGGGTLRG